MRRITRCPSCGSTKVRHVIRDWTSVYKGQRIRPQVSRLTSARIVERRSLTLTPCARFRPTGPPCQVSWRLPERLADADDQRRARPAAVARSRRCA